MSNGKSPLTNPGVDAAARQLEQDLAASRAAAQAHGGPEELKISSAPQLGRAPEPTKLAAQPRAEVRAESKLRFRTGAEIALEKVQETEWIVKPWIAAGSITEVDGKVKVAGKTTWVTHLVRATLDGVPFLGEAAVKGPVVYLTEQNPLTFRVAMERAGLLGRQDFVVLFWVDSLRMSWQDVIAEAARECQRRGARLLVVDTIAQFAHLPGDAENNAGDALSAMRPLQAIASTGIAVLVVRHERKSGGEVGDSGRGSSAFAGAVDTVLSLRRPEGNHPPTLRLIQAVSRFSETPSELLIELTPEGYVARGTTSDVAAQAALDAIMNAVPRSETEAMTIDQIIERTSVPRTTAQRAINELLAAMRLRRAGEGKRNDPHKYYAPLSAQTLSAQTYPSDGQQETAHRGLTDSAQTPTHDEQNGQKETGVFAKAPGGVPLADNVSAQTPSPSTGSGQIETAPDTGAISTQTLEDELNDARLTAWLQDVAPVTIMDITEIVRAARSLGIGRIATLSWIMQAAADGLLEVAGPGKWRKVIAP